MARRVRYPTAQSRARRMGQRLAGRNAAGGAGIAAGDQPDKQGNKVRYGQHGLKFGVPKAMQRRNWLPGQTTGNPYGTGWNQTMGQWNQGQGATNPYNTGWANRMGQYGHNTQPGNGPRPQAGGGGGQNLPGLMQGFTPEWNGVPLEVQRMQYRWQQMTPEQRRKWAARKGADDTWGYFNKGGGTQWAENANPRQIYKAYMNMLKEFTPGPDVVADWNARLGFGQIDEEKWRKLRRRAGLDPNAPLPQSGSVSTGGWRSQGLPFPGAGGLDGITLTPALQAALQEYSGNGQFGTPMWAVGNPAPGSEQEMMQQRKWANIQKLAGQPIPFMRPGEVYNYLNPEQAAASAALSGQGRVRAGSGATEPNAQMAALQQQASQLQQQLASLPQDPTFEMQRRLIEDQLQALLAPINAGRENLSAFGNLQNTRLATNQGIDYQSLLDNLAARGIVNSGLYGQNLGDLETNYLRQRQDLASNLASGYGDLSTQESGAYLNYNQQLMEALMDLANRQAQNTSLTGFSAATQPNQTQNKHTHAHGPGRHHGAAHQRKHTHAHKRGA